MLGFSRVALLQHAGKHLLHVIKPVHSVLSRQAIFIGSVQEGEHLYHFAIIVKILLFAACFLEDSRVTINLSLVDVLLQLLDQVITTTQHQDVMRRNFPTLDQLSQHLLTGTSVLPMPVAIQKQARLTNCS